VWSDLLRCPRSGQPLSPDGPYALVTKSDRGGPSFRYPVVGGVPILVDFDSSVLVESETLDRAAVSPVHVPRYGMLGAIAKGLASPRNPRSARNYERFAKLLKGNSPAPQVLVVGGATPGDGMRLLYDDPTIELCSFDVYRSPYIQFVADAHQIPLPDGSFDGVIIQAVLEHVLEPTVVVAEIHRVLRSGGLVYAETPFLQPVHGGPYDFTRFTESGHRYLFRAFERLDSGPLNAAGTTLLLSIDYFVRSLFRSRAAGKAAKLALFWLQHMDSLMPRRFAVDAASGTYFLGRRADFKIGAHDIIRHYQGSD
jgi:SAM-dependent methyltransferase